MPMKSCTCIDLANKELELHNTELALAISMTGECAKAIIETHRILKLRDGKRPLRVVATYCPFCGKKYPKSKKVNDRG
jgi:hypothetical protein